VRERERERERDRFFFFNSSSSSSSASPRFIIFEEKESRNKKKLHEALFFANKNY